MQESGVSAFLSGEIFDTVGEKFGISQSAISQQLKVLRENGFASVAIDGNRRLYTLDSTGFEQMDEWLAPFRRFWAPKFEALASEVARGKRSKKNP
ncbi:MAG: helix-turn-helix transcriptional regulator [Planctomycetales bacterium]|nr:helix-turn-helix transcriptional regulator [Planctomycetales bacterium]